MVCYVLGMANKKPKQATAFSMKVFPDDEARWKRLAKHLGLPLQWVIRLAMREKCEKENVK